MCVFRLIALDNGFEYVVAEPRQSRAGYRSCGNSSGSGIPAVFVAGYIFGANGLVAAQAVADLITFIIAVPITVPVLKLLRKSENEVF